MKPGGMHGQGKSGACCWEQRQVEGTVCGGWSHLLKKAWVCTYLVKWLDMPKNIWKEPQQPVSRDCFGGTTFFLIWICYNKLLWHKTKDWHRDLPWEAVRAICTLWALPRTRESHSWASGMKRPSQSWSGLLGVYRLRTQQPLSTMCLDQWSSLRLYGSWVNMVRRNRTIQKPLPADNRSHYLWNVPSALSGLFLLL